MMSNEWKMVPVEPTEDMLIAGDNCGIAAPETFWSEMLAVSPMPPAGDVEVLPKRREQPNGFTAVGWANLRGWNEYHDAVAPLFTRLTAERDGLLAHIKEISNDTGSNASHDGSGSIGASIGDSALLDVLKLQDVANSLIRQGDVSGALMEVSEIIGHVSELQSELTKARELLRVSNPADGQDYKSWWNKRAEVLQGRESAPAAKGGE